MKALDQHPFPLGTMPALHLHEASHPHRDRRGVNLRWLTATSLMMAGSAATLWLVLHAALHDSSTLTAPELAAILPAGRAHVSGTRTDRLVLRETPTSARPAPIRTVRLQSTGMGSGPVTVLVADLAHVETLPNDDAEPPAASAPAHDRAAPPLASALPTLITAGTNQPLSLPALAASYAASGRSPIEPGPSGTPLNVTAAARTAAATPPDRVDRIVAQRGDSLARALAGAGGFTDQDIADLARALGAPGSTGFAGGEAIELRHGGDAVSARPYKVELHRADGSTVSAALTDDERYAPIDPESPQADDPAGKAPSPDVTDDDESETSDSGSLREALGALDGHRGIDQALAASIVRVLGAGLDLGHGVTASDKLEAVYTKGDEGADGNLLFAALDRQGRTTRFYRFVAPDDGSVDYYDQNGRSIMKFLLRKPVANGRLGDGFGWRIHPVLHDRRFHEGVDYRAPYGSPIVAAGAGVVEKIGWEKGYGNYIRVRHDLGYETTYGHVSTMARGMSVGRRVQQGETIAYVGSTGYSTGPHLYYEVRINGRNVDPLSVRLAAGRILDSGLLAEFGRQRDRIDTLVKASVVTSGG